MATKSARANWWSGLSDSERRAVQQRLAQARDRARAGSARWGRPPMTGERAIDHYTALAFRAAVAHFGTPEDALKCVQNTWDEIYQQWLEDHPPLVVS